MGEIESALVKKCSKFKSKYGNPSTILYPCCGYDSSPSEVFDKILYIDKDPDAVDFLQRPGVPEQGKISLSIRKA